MFDLVIAIRLSGLKNNRQSDYQLEQRLIHIRVHISMKVLKDKEFSMRNIFQTTDFLQNP